MAGPRVQDFTATTPRLAVEVMAGEVFELLLGLFVLGAGHDEGGGDFEVEEAWYEAMRTDVPADHLEVIGGLRDCCGVWLSLVGDAAVLGPPFTLDRFVGHLAETDPVALRRRMLSVANMQDRDPIDERVLERAAAGGPGALDGLPRWCTESSGLVALLELEPAEARTLLIEMLTRFREAGPFPPETVAVLERDAEHKRALARHMDLERLVEVATNGITVAPQQDLAGVILIPSVVVRPWVIITERDGHRIFCYSVADEHLSADPEAPPSWMVQFYKALGDERRLRILGRLAEGPASLSELVGVLGLAKSTVHHHVRQLRSAGLVRVTVGDEKEYSLRVDAVPEAARLLEGFLGLGMRSEE